MLRVDAIDVFYRDLQVLWNISLTVSSGEIVAIIGTNGSGKTTLLSTILGLNRPQRGSIFFNDVRIDRKRTNEIVRAGISLIPENRGLFPHMTVMDNLEMGAFPPRARGNKKETLDRIYDTFSVLEVRANQLAGSLSGGEQQMLAIGKALMSKPLLLICDEMSLGLAPIMIKHILQMLRRIREEFGASLLVVEQNVHMTLKLCDRAYIMENGRIVRHDVADLLLDDDRLRDAYFGQI
jgi:branched-chain amino acid transport system ATP-binding protein